MQNPKSKILACPPRRLMRDWSRWAELACIASRIQIQNPESRIQNAKSKIQSPGAWAAARFRSDHPGIRDAPSSDPLLHSCGGLQNFARPRRRILTRAEFCSGLRRIRVGGTRMQIPKSKASSAPAGRGSAQNPESYSSDCARRESRAESRDFGTPISDFWYADNFDFSRGECRIMADHNHKNKMSCASLPLAQ